MPSTVETAPPPRHSRARRFLPLAALAAAILAIYLTGAHRYLTFDALAQNRVWLHEQVDALGWAAPPLYALVYAVAVAFSIPGALILTLAGGFLFGTWLGGAATVIGATMGACAIFLVARTALGDALRAKAGPFARKLEEGFRKDAASYLLVLRLVPLFPFWLVNLVPAILGVPLRTFALGTLVGIVPGTLVYSSVGSGLGALFDRGEQPDFRIILEPQFLLPILGLAALAMVPVIYKRVKKRDA